MDYLTLGTGQKIQVPFDQLILFSTNLDPDDLVDEAFLRRIPYKIHIKDPSEPEFTTLFKNVADDIGCAFSEQVVQELLGAVNWARVRPSACAICNSF